MRLVTHAQDPEAAAAALEAARGPVRRLPGTGPSRCDRHPDRAAIQVRPAPDTTPAQPRYECLCAECLAIDTERRRRSVIFTEACEHCGAALRWYGHFLLDRDGNQRCTASPTGEHEA